MARHTDLTGQTFGRLTVLEKVGKDKNHRALYKVRCTCGTEKVTSGHSMVNGFTESCGCLWKERNAVRYKEERQRKPYQRKTKGVVHGGRPPLPKEVRDQVAYLVRAGTPYRKIAAMLPVNIGTVSNIASEYGITPVPRKQRSSTAVASQEQF